MDAVSGEEKKKQESRSDAISREPEARETVVCHNSV